MAFPYDFESNFEAGNVAEWDSETDTVSQLSVIHYTELARRVPKAAPFRGAYCLMAELVGGTADAILTEGDINIADAATAYFRFSIFFAENFAATANDTFAILELKGAAAAVTVSIGGRIVAATGDINLGVGGAATGAVPTAFTAEALRRGVWYTVHVAVTVVAAGTGTVAITVTAEDAPIQGGTAASVASIANVAAGVTDGVFGIQDHLATTTGIILLDNFAMDSDPLPWLSRFEERLLLTKSAHVFVGNGAICEVSLLTGSATDNVLKVFDTDQALLNRQVGEIDSVAATETVESAAVMPVSNGCYVTLEGTEPRALLTIKRAIGYGSSAAIRNHGLRA